MRSLTELANLHGSDKGTIGPSPLWSANNYTDVYEAYLCHLRELPVTILEIGLGVDGPHWEAHIQHGRNATGGASVRMWRDYLLNGSVVGIDINPASHLDGDRLRTFVADQGSPDDLARVIDAAAIERFDVIVDDGSHKPEHQQTSLGFLFPLLSPGGIYFVEDLASNGLGDRASGRAASSQVLNTRSVLAAYRDRGRFPEPHALYGADRLADAIESVTLHCPIPTTTLRPRLRTWRRPLGRVRGYAPGSERLCAIRKKDSPAVRSSR